jgi:hypothetical protein
MGKALSHALKVSTSGVPATSPNKIASVSRFADAFAQHTVVGGDGWTGPPHLLPGLLKSALQSVANLTLSVRDPPEKVMPSHAWITEVTRRLCEIAEPVFSGDLNITSGVATSVRLAALCLAVEADSLIRVIQPEAPRGSSDLGAIFRRIAAGVSVLQRRSADSQLITETIMLAID